MEQQFEHLERFMASAGCIFQLKPMDYPSLLQQHLITAHIELRALLKTTPHPEVVRLLHSPIQRQLDTFLPGLLYALLLDFSAASVLFEAYMPILRSESWLSLDRLLQQIIRESFSAIKVQHRSPLALIIAKLNYFGQLSADLLALAIKTIDAFDLSQSSLSYNGSFLELFQRILTQGIESDYLKDVLADRLFYKLLRMIALLNTVDEDSTREYRNRCVSTAYRIFAFSKDICLAMGWGAAEVMRQLERDQTVGKLLEECREQLMRSPPPTENPAVASVRLSMVLPMRVEATLRFIIKEEISQLEIGVQMNWAFGRNDTHFELLLIDILRYILAQPLQQLPSKQGIYLLEWLFYRSCSNNNLFELWKSELFHPCFCDPCPYPAAPQRALRFLAYLLQSNFEFGETLLVYLLRQMSVPTYSKRLRQLLLEANTLQILDLQMLFSHPRLSPRAKSQLRAAIGDSSIEDVQKFKEEEAQPYYDPLEQMQRKESEMDLQFSGSESSENFAGYSQQEPIESKQSEDKGMMKIKVEKMFAEDLGESLTVLMLDPSLPVYKEFFKKLMDEIKTFKLNGEIETIELFLSETAKLTYLLFQNQFQEHGTNFPRDDNIIVNLLSIVAAEWRTNSLIGQCCKKIIRKIIDYFPTAEPGIWRQFLLYFRRGVIAQVRQMKQWLLPKEKSEYAMALLRELGPVNKDLIDNAEQLKLPLC